MSVWFFATTVLLIYLLQFPFFIMFPLAKFEIQKKTLVEQLSYSLWSQKAATNKSSLSALTADMWLIFRDTFITPLSLRSFATLSSKRNMTFTKLLFASPQSWTKVSILHLIDYNHKLHFAGRLIETKQSKTRQKVLKKNLMRILSWRIHLTQQLQVIAIFSVEKNICKSVALCKL